MSVIVVVMGVAGSGKTTIGEMLADAIPCPFLEGDSLHSRANVEKMSRGVPLTDADRAPWLSAIHARMVDAFNRGESLVVGCSALKQSYRAILGDDVPVTWVYLKGSSELIQARMAHRTNHFMKANMVASQFAALEEPLDALVIDISQPPDAIVERILSELRTDGPGGDSPNGSSHRRR
jgi:gluconokinase